MEFFIKKSESVKNIAGKLLQIQKEGVNVNKSSKNPFFKSNYADLGEHLENILPICSEVGIVVTQLPSDSHLCTLIIDSESGEWMEAYYPLVKGLIVVWKDGKAVQLSATAQETGSSMTYARRFSLGAIFNVNALDDDGNTVSGKGVQSTTVKPAPTSTPKNWINTKSDPHFISAKTKISAGEIKTKEELNNMYAFNTSPSNTQLAATKAAKKELEDMLTA